MSERPAKDDEVAKAGRAGEGGETDREAWLEKGVALRVFFYIFGTHLFAGFIWILFYVGERAK
ncbi:DUF6126 family protein [Streptomyces sp. NPDC047315]|uniref:DUF6126 family protein n=1 Tax=Streptomyces sp. NPDC047315 TaxID=3155142 RepID=UPI0033DEEF51